MSSIIPQLMESVTHSPSAAEHPLGVSASICVAAVLAAAGVKRYYSTAEASAAPYSNGALLEQQIQPNWTQARRDRLSPLLAEMIGAGLLAAQYFGHPTYESTIANTHAKVIAVTDQSFSMTRTHDLGSNPGTRAQAVASSLSVVPYEGSLGVIQTGANNKVTIPLTKNWQYYKSRLGKSEVDPNGGQLVQAMDLAGSLLQQASAKHEGTVAIISDGGVEDSQQAIAGQAAKLKKAGVAVKAVVIGTANGRYTLSDSKLRIDSSARADRFSGLGADNVIEAKTAGEVDTAITKLIRDAGTSHEKHAWPGFGIVGGALFAAGFLRDKWQRTGRIV